MKTQKKIENEDKCIPCEATEGMRPEELLKLIRGLTEAVNNTESKDPGYYLLSFLSVLTLIGDYVREHKLGYMEETFVKVLMASIRGTTLDKVIFPKAKDTKNEKPDVMYV